MTYSTTPQLGHLIPSSCGGSEPSIAIMLILYRRPGSERSSDLPRSRVQPVPEPWGQAVAPGGVTRV
jgi:hypothetical protein